MRRFLVLIAGGLGLGTLWRRRRQNHLPALGPDPAAELRARLAENRAGALDEGAGEDALLEGPPADAAESPLDPMSRRRALHERTRSSIDDLT